MNDPASKRVWEGVAEGRAAVRLPKQGNSPVGICGGCSEVLSLPCSCRWLVWEGIFILLKVH